MTTTARARASKVILRATVVAALCLVGCEDEPAEPQDPGGGEPESAEPKLTSGIGVDVEAKRIRIGALNDESGPAATIGKPYAIGKRILFKLVNEGGSGLLPAGWKIDLVERDHGYNPGKSVQAYNEIHDEVLFIATSLGTPNTMPLRPMLTRDKMLALPASLSSEMAEHEYTPPVGPSYKVEAMRAMDWVVNNAPEGREVKAAIVYQQDDYGMDGQAGWKAAAAHHDVTIVSEQTVQPGQKDFTAIVTALKNAGATHVLLTVLPSASAPILGTAAQLEFKPVWLGNTPAWLDRFWDASVVPHAVFEGFHWVTGLPYWGEDLPGMERILSAHEKYGEGSSPDSYIVLSWVQGLQALEAVRRAIDQGDITRQGLKKGLHSMKHFTAGGLLQPSDYSQLPYFTSRKTRVLKPDFDNKSWTEIAPYAAPRALEPRAGADQPEAVAEGDAPDKL